MENWNENDLRRKKFILKRDNLTPYLFFFLDSYRRNIQRVLKGKKTKQPNNHIAYSSVSLKYNTKEQRLGEIQRLVRDDFLALKTIPVKMTQICVYKQQYTLELELDYKPKLQSTN